MTINSLLQASFNVDEEGAAQMSKLFQKETIKKGEFFLKTKQYCDRLSFIESGFLRLFALEGDKEITQWISTKGNFVTDIASFLFGLRARWNIQALSDCEILTIRKSDYITLKKDFPNWTEIENGFLSVCFITLENRVFNHLSLTAEQRFDELVAYNKELLNHVPLQYIASMLGMSPETLSRIRQKKFS